MWAAVTVWESATAPTPWSSRCGAWDSVTVIESPSWPTRAAGMREHLFVIAVGDPQQRRDLAAIITGCGGTLTSVVHPTAFVATSASVAPGCVVAPFAFLAVDSVLEGNVVVNAYACVGHDCVVGTHSVMSPYSTLNGYAAVDPACLVGTHASVAAGVRVGRHSKVASGSVVLADVPPGSLVVGVPGAARLKYPVE